MRVARAAVPALLTDGKRVLWDECVLVICQTKAQPLPTARGLAAAPKPVSIWPGSITTTRMPKGASSSLKS